MTEIETELLMKSYKPKRAKLRALEGFKKLGKDPKVDRITFKDLEHLVKHLTLKYCLYLEEELTSMDYLTQELLDDKKTLRRTIESLTETIELINNREKKLEARIKFMEEDNDATANPN
jgi:septal ring factor EnvC (AmiA/AmiB activator)|tara:strand:+ start:50 stop:406 length:357 start_codon:yes stop_codon:yes gene_type:complete